MPGVVTLAFPSTDDIQVVIVELGEESWDLGRIVLKVGVHRDHQIAYGGLKTDIQSTGFAEVPAESDGFDMRVGSSQFANHIP